jgi:uncharacterized protein (DUF1778 family)
MRYSIAIKWENNMSTLVQKKDDVIQIRASAQSKALLVQAATLKGQKLSEFMLESARIRAEETLLDRRSFFLNEDDHNTFIALLDSPFDVNDAVKSRLLRKASWAI